MFESELELSVDSKSGSQGTLRLSGAKQYPGFELSFEDHFVHLAGFLGKSELTSFQYVREFLRHEPYKLLTLNSSHYRQ